MLVGLLACNSKADEDAAEGDSVVPPISLDPNVTIPDTSRHYLPNDSSDDRDDPGPTIYPSDTAGF